VPSPGNNAANYHSHLTCLICHTVWQSRRPAVTQHHFDRRSTAAFHRRSDAVACPDSYWHKARLPAGLGRQGARTGSTPTQMQKATDLDELMAERGFRNTRRAASRLLNDLQLLGCRPIAAALDH